MNKTQKIILSLLVLAMLAFSAAALPINALITPNTISIAGSSTVLPIAQKRQRRSQLIGTTDCCKPQLGQPLSQCTISTMNIAGLGSGTAFPAILSTTGAKLQTLVKCQDLQPKANGTIQCRHRPDLGSRR